MSDRRETKQNDLWTLAGIVKGPGCFPTPSPERTLRLIENGLVKKQRGTLRPTLKGRIVNYFCQLRELRLRPVD